MQKIIILFILIMLSFPVYGISQYAIPAATDLIPLSKLVNWSNVGVEGGIPRFVDMEINISTLKASNPGINDDNIFIIARDQAKLYKQSNPGAWVSIYYPAGVYSFNNGIVLDQLTDQNLIIRGAGSGSTILNSNVTSGSLFRVSGGTSGAFINLDGSQGFTKGSKIIKTVSDVVPTILNNGDWIELVQSNGNWIGDYDGGSGTPDADIVGQIIQILSISGDKRTIELKDELRIDYQGSLTPRIQRIEPIRSIGLEDFVINYVGSTSSDGGPSNIIYGYAVNCWVSGVESYNACSAHISVGQSSHIEVRGCWLHHATSYSGGGHGYGISIANRSTNCLVENNIFSYLRHSMIISRGANGNVFGYNYSRDVHSTAPFYYPDNLEPDISIHGHYAFANLFEGNSVEFAAADDHWGSNGPYNTFFRNKFTKSIILERANYSNVVACEWTSTGARNVNYSGNNLFSNFGDDGSDAQTITDLYGRMVASDCTVGPLIDHYFSVDALRWSISIVTNKSYYRTTAPSFIGSAYTWPPMGTRYGIPTSGGVPVCGARYSTTQNIPAVERWNGSKVIATDPIQYRYKIELTNMISPEGGNTSGGYYKINNVVSSVARITSATIETYPPQSYYFTEWSDGVKQNLRTISLNGEQTLYAKIKQQFASNASTAISNSSQRKIVRTSNPSTLHLVYESMGSIWYETSTDEGATWNPMNNNQPIGDGNRPSIISQDASVFIAYNTSDGVKVRWFAKSTGENTFTYKSAPTDITSKHISGVNTNPVIAITTPVGGTPQLMVVWEGNVSIGLTTVKGLRFWTSNLNNYNYTFSTGINGIIDGATTQSTNPTIASSGSNGGAFQLAWQEGNAIIKYKQFYTNNTQGTTYDVSNGNGYTHNYNPSIIATNNYLYPARISWVTKRFEESGGEEFAKTTAGDGEWKYRTMFTDPSTIGTFWTFGDAVNTTNLNINTTFNEYIVAWSKSNGTNEYTRNSSLGNSIRSFVKNTSTIISGKDVQIIPGSSFSDMYGIMLNTESTPYKFNRSDNVTSMGKIQALPDIFSGREGVVSNGNAQFYFTLGDVTVDGVNIEFEEKADSIVIDTRELMNQYLITKPFTLNNQSNFLYGVVYGITDSVACADLVSNGSIGYKVQLVNAQTGTVIGEFDNVSYSNSNVFQYQNIGYQVNTEGIGNVTVKLKLVVESTVDAQYRLSNKHNTEPITALGKTNSKRKQIGYQGSLAIKEYALSQNYPNPFNPSTNISYALPKGGYVSLKVYDILGKEIVTLVNKQHEYGSYSVVFDGSKLASGMYIYKLTSGSFSEVKKMMLVK